MSFTLGLSSSFRMFSRFLGTPFFHSMLEKSRLYTTDITVFVDPRTVLVPDLISTLNYAYELDRDWLLVASLRNVSYFPFHLDDAGEHWLREDGRRVRRQEVRRSTTPDRKFTAFLGKQYH